MTSFFARARGLLPHQITIRMPWHDGGWTGCVCALPFPRVVGYAALCDYADEDAGRDGGSHDA